MVDLKNQMRFSGGARRDACRIFVNFHKTKVLDGRTGPTKKQ